MSCSRASARGPTLTTAVDDGQRKAVVDESCLRDLADVWRTKSVGWRRQRSGDPKLYALLVSVHSRFGCLPVAHIQDACDAHAFLMESPRADGRYLCVAGGHQMAQIARLLAARYPPFKPGERLSRDFDASCSSSMVSSKRLLDLGFRFQYGVTDVVADSVAQCVDHGFLEHPET
nr:unnamed protein product [Digitaria exilis]